MIRGGGVKKEGAVQFGVVSHTCLEKNVSLLEMYKLIPSFLRTFEVCSEYIPLLMVYT